MQIFPDIRIKTFKERTCIMYNVTVPVDKNISLLEFEKPSKYNDLEIEVEYGNLKQRQVQ